MSKKFTPAFVKAVKMWKAAGYTAESTSLALMTSPVSVRAFACDGERWGHKSLSQRILNDLTAKADVPPNLEEIHGRFLRLWGAGYRLPLETLVEPLLGTSVERIAGWAEVELKRRRARVDVQRIHAKLCKTANQ